MKKIAIFLFLFVFLGLVSWACRRPLPVFPNPPGAFTPTPTSTIQPVSTVVCGFTPVPNNYIIMTVTFTPGPSYPPTAIPTYGPVVTYPNPPVFFTNGNVFHTLAQFQAVFGNWVPPVNFNNQMVLEATLPAGCFTTDIITSVCEGPTQITVNLTQIHPDPNGPQCNAQGEGMIPIAVNQSNLPVVWQITEVVN